MRQFPMNNRMATASAADGNSCVSMNIVLILGAIFLASIFDISILAIIIPAIMVGLILLAMRRRPVFSVAAL